VVREGFGWPPRAAQSVAIPSTVYIGTLMTENVFYPVFLWLAYVLVLALERPTLKRQLVVLALCVLAFVTRAQAVALIAAVVTAPLAARLDRSAAARAGSARGSRTYAIVRRSGSARHRGRGRSRGVRLRRFSAATA